MKEELVSIIVPLFNEEANVPLLANALRPVMDDQSRGFEVLLMDDGSSDATFEAVRREAASDGRFRGIRFRRNFGQTAALKAGLERARGAVCITMDGDLQHDPKEIPRFLERMDQGYDMVCGYRDKRDDAWIRRFPSRIANLVARRVSGLDLRDFGSTFRAYRTVLAREIPVYGELHRFIPVFMAMQTDSIEEIPIQVAPRAHGVSNYGLGRTFRVLSDLVLLLFFAGFFNRPIHIFGYISVLTGLPGLLILGWLSVSKIFGSLAIMDYGPLFFLGLLLVLFAGQMFTTGIVCEYLVRVYYGDEQRRPYSIRDEV